MRAMKDSGVEWIGEIPEEWLLMKTLWLLEMPITDGPHETPALYDDGIPFISAEAVSFGCGGIDFSHKRGYISREYYDECCKKYTPRLHDIYMIKSGATTGRVSMVDTEEMFTIWSPLAVFRVNREKALPRFVFYSMQSDYYQKQISLSWSFGTQQNIGMRVLEQLKIAIPDIEKQKGIATFLDAKCAEIDKVVEQTRTTIEEYKKLKQAIITEAVTKGVRGPRPMKPSGVEWIGDIPEEWDISKVGRFISRVECGVSVNAGVVPAGEGELGVLKTSCVSTGKFNPDENKAVNQDEVLRVACPVQRGCLIVSRMNTPDLVGACGYVEESLPSIYLPDRLWQVSIKSDYLAKFVYYYLISRVARCYYASVAVGTSSSMQNISQKQFSDMRCTCPSLPEQQEIVAYLDTKCAEIDRIIGKKEQLIEELGRYKKSLIYEYVTGKKQVLYK